MRISEKFRELEAKGEKALIMYVSCGDPSAEQTVHIARDLIDSGCDILELGLPFSDPLADGPTIQAASQRAIANGMNTDKYFSTCKKIIGIPKVCMTYYNLIYQYGLERFVKACSDAEITGLIVPDLPPEESGGLAKACKDNGVDLIFIVSPETGERRLHYINTRICDCCSSGFIYLQSVLGVTGARDEMSIGLSENLERIKKGTKLPVAVGFGVSRPEQVKELIRQGADGIIVGSALIKKIDRGEEYKGFVKQLKAATLI
jgi:tryptophan synthase alpha chain